MPSSLPALQKCFCSLQQVRCGASLTLCNPNFRLSACRFKLEPLPAKLTLDAPSFPLSFATWASGSAAQIKHDYQWQDSSFEPFIPAAPFMENVEVC